MSLYKIMIVDSDDASRDEMVGKIDWFGLGFDIAAIVSNGQEALDKMGPLDVDVVITDIKIALADGQTLASAVRGYYPNIKLIVFSEQDRFDSAREAIRLKAEDFLLKPIAPSELASLLRYLRRKLDSEFAEKLNVEKLRENFENNESILREHFLNELLWGSLSADDISHGISLYKTNISRHGTKLVCVYHIDFAENGEPFIPRDFVPISIKRIVDSAFNNVCRCVSFAGPQHIIAVTSWSDREHVRELISISDSICSDCRKVIGTTVTAGIGRGYTALTDIHLSYEQALAALEYKSIVGRGHAIYIEDIQDAGQTQSLTAGDPSEQNLLAVIKFGNPSQLEALIETTVKQLHNSSLPMWQRRAMAANLASAVSQVCRMHGVEEHFLLEGISDFSAAFSPENDVLTLTNRFKRIFSALRESISSHRMSAAHNIIESAKEYISVNYTNPKLSVEMLCEYLHISQSYFSTIFKQQTKQSYVGYLTETRIQKSKELLDRTNEKTYEIAKSVGYDDPNYFSYVFKKIVGCSPSQYRKR